MIAFVFPGQGAQSRGMGAALFDAVREFASLEREADAILGYSVRQLCLEDPGDRLRDTRYTQPSLYVVNALYYYQALSQGLRPRYLAGHSLGEYNALLAAGVFDFLTGLRLVKKRAELMSEAKNGGMAAVVGLKATEIATVIEQNRLDSLDIANFNSPLQTVVSGPLDAIGTAGPLFEKAGARMYVPLQVSAAFHSRYMADAAKAFGGFLQSMSFAAAEIPVISNVTARPYPPDKAGDNVKWLLTNQIKRPVQWTHSIEFLAGKGVNEFKETGPGNVLTRLMSAR